MFQFRTKAGHKGRLIITGYGWRARFERGRFATDDERLAGHVRRHAARFPEYKITEEAESPAKEPAKGTG